MDYTLKFSFEEILVSSLSLRVLHLLLQLVAQDAIELVDVLLLVPLIVVPAESLKELMSAHWVLTLGQLQLKENSLQADWDVLEASLRLRIQVRRHLVDCISERSQEEESLDQ